MANPETTTPVVILTNNYKVTGRIALVPGARLTDYIDENKDFIAITDAVVWDRAGQRKILSASFLDLNREDVEIIAPANAVKDEA